MERGLGYHLGVLDAAWARYDYRVLAAYRYAFAGLYPDRVSCLAEDELTVHAHLLATLVRVAPGLLDGYIPCPLAARCGAACMGNVYSRLVAPGCFHDTWD